MAGADTPLTGDTDTAPSGDTMILVLQPLPHACCCSVVLADGSTCIGHGIADYSGRYAPHIGVVGQVGGGDM